MWNKTEDKLPPKEVLVLGNDGDARVYLVTYCGDYWRYHMVECRAGPRYWHLIPPVPDHSEDDTLSSP